MKALQQVLKMAKKINLWISDHEDKIDRKIASEIEEKKLGGLSFKDEKVIGGTKDV
jgi:hypothetical protein